MSVYVSKSLLQTFHGILLFPKHFTGLGLILISPDQHGQNPQNIRLNHKRIALLALLPFLINLLYAGTDLRIHSFFMAHSVLKISSTLNEGPQIFRVKGTDLLCYKLRRKNHNQKLHSASQKFPAMRLYIIENDNIILFHGIFLSINEIVSLSFQNPGDLKIAVPVPGSRMTVGRVKLHF